MGNGAYLGLKGIKGIRAYIGLKGIKGKRGLLGTRGTIEDTGFGLLHPLLVVTLCLFPYRRKNMASM